jgi:phenylalanyl-tRNA synthetase beta chain
MELDVTALVDAPRRDRAFREPSPFPPSIIDLDFVVDEALPAARIADTLRGAAGPVLEEVRAFDEFRGAQVGAGRKSLAFALRFRSDHTLTQDEVAALRQRCIDAVTGQHGATLRT